MVTFKEGSRRNARGQQLYTVAYLPEGPPRALLVWHHGYGEHIGRYQYVFTRLAEAGIAVHAEDAFGHGKSEPHEERERALVWGFHLLVEDCAAFAREVRGGYQAGLPAFMGGQSMGGLVAVHCVLEAGPDWAGLVLLSAAIDLEEWTLSLRVQAALGNLLAALVPRARIVQAVKPVELSSEPEVVAAYIADPLNTVGDLRTRTANELLKGFHVARRGAPQLRLPILALHGARDKVTSPRAVRVFLAATSSTDKQFVEVPDELHELLMTKKTRDGVVAQIAEWILAHSSTGQSKI